MQLERLKQQDEISVKRERDDSDDDDVALAARYLKPINVYRIMQTAEENWYNKFCWTSTTCSLKCLDDSFVKIYGLLYNFRFEP